MLVLIGMLSAVLSIPLWAAIHELSHVALARVLGGPLKIVRMRLYPHHDELAGGSFRWASVYWRYERADVSKEVHGWALLAPRIPDALAAILLPLTYLLRDTPMAMIAALPFLVGGLVDLWVGSVGTGEYSDSRMASRLLGFNIWVTRIAGFSVLALSVISFFLLLFGANRV